MVFSCISDRKKTFKGRPYFYNQVGFFYNQIGLLIKSWHGGLNPHGGTPFMGFNLGIPFAVPVGILDMIFFT